MSEWRDIATAPRDGSVIRAYGFAGRYGGFQTDVKWSADHESWMLYDPCEDGWFTETSGLTHWQPIPAPPDTQKE